MEITEKIASSVLAIIAVVGLAIAFVEPEKKVYSVEIEFTDGSKRTVQFESPSDAPKIESTGCLYNYSTKSWICGCRDIKYSKISK